LSPTASPAPRLVPRSAYDTATGRQKDDAVLCAAIVYPTIPLVGSANAPDVAPAAERFAAVETPAAERRYRSVFT
jgi:hypothetical protein